MTHNHNSNEETEKPLEVEKPMSPVAKATLTILGSLVIGAVAAYALFYLFFLVAFSGFFFI